MKSENNVALPKIEMLYIQTLVGIATATGFGVAHQVVNDQEGVLWMMREETTKPDAWIRYRFDDEGVAIAVQIRNDNPVARSSYSERFSFAGGIDDALPHVHRLLTANQIASKVAA